MTTIPLDEIPNYTRKDFVSDQTVRWCPGCGDYAILAAIQKALPDIGVRKEDIVFISGIGCSSRFPYYMDTYGMHTVHGRAPTVATGLKVANPDLSVWIVTGDGDGLSIGGNHLLHVCRRNVNVNLLLFNNQIYGLTKGQYSPTSPVGKRTKSTPMGSIDREINPLAVALSAEATFVARTMDTDTKHMEVIFKEGASHEGTSFMEILQNCVIFNDGVWSHVADRSTRDDNALFLEHGKPMIYGKEHDKGIRANGFKLEVVDLGDEYDESDLVVHDETDPNLAYLIARMTYPEFPVPMGVIYRSDAPVYEKQVMAQVAAAAEKKAPDLKALYFADDTWTVEGEANYSAEDMRAFAFGQTESDVASEFDESYVEEVKGGATIDLDRNEIHDGLESDPLSNLYDASRGVISVGLDATVADAVNVMQEHNIGALIVTDAVGHPTGIFTEFDILQRVATKVADLTTVKVIEYMTPNPDVLPEDASINSALNLMALHHYRHVPVVNDAYIVTGIISFRDVVHYIEKYFDTR